MATGHIKANAKMDDYKLTADTYLMLGRRPYCNSDYMMATPRELRRGGRVKEASPSIEID